MPPKVKGERGRAAIITAVKTPLGFFVLVVLVVETALGGLALRTTGQFQLTALCGMLGVILALTGVVCAVAIWRPEALRGERTGAGDQLRDFCEQISGHWWERIQLETPSALSFVEIRPNPGAYSVTMKGDSFGLDGKIAARWETVASAVNLNERKVFYQWTGFHPLRPEEPYLGFGEISLRESNSKGVGFFLDTNEKDWKTTTRKAVVLVRCTPEEEQVMTKGSAESILNLIQRKLKDIS